LYASVLAEQRPDDAGHRFHKPEREREEDREGGGEREGEGGEELTGVRERRG
jgi:hypothetical protein